MTEASIHTRALPTAAKVAERLRRHALRGPTRWVLATPLVVLAMVGTLLYFGRSADNRLGILAVLSLWAVVIIALTLIGMARAHRLHRLDALVTRVQERAALREHQTAFDLAWRLIPEANRHAELHVRLISYLAHSLDQLKAYDAAIAAYDHLLEDLQLDQHGRTHLAVQRAVCMLMGNRLSDADASLRRLRAVIDGFDDDVLEASYRLAVLVQRAKTNHFDDVIAEADEMLDRLRPLGVDAGYGHAIVALAHHAQIRRQEEPSAAAQLLDGAQLWWRRATLLVPAHALLDRLDELAVLLQDERLAPAAALPEGGAA